MNPIQLQKFIRKTGTLLYSGEGVEYFQSGDLRAAVSPGYNYIYNVKDGKFARWGETLQDDPDMSPHNEILDIEITSMCRGPKNRLCSFCYKSNNPTDGHNMTLDQFKNIIDKMPWLTQTALGADAHGTMNPDMFDMMHYARSKGIVPNLTIADVSEEVAQKLAEVAGAVAVSVYPHAGKDVAYDSIKRLTDAGMTQINIHYMISKKRMEFTYELIDDLKNDPRLAKVNAIVFLSLKQKGRGAKHEMVSQEDYRTLVDYCLENEVPFGFDSCSAPSFMNAVKDRPNYEMFKTMAEDCESTLFSSYINEKGEFYPCSFTENWVEGGWSKGIDVLSAPDFAESVWNNSRVVDFKTKLTNNKDERGCRNCPAFAVCGIDMRIAKELDVEVIAA